MVWLQKVSEEASNFLKFLIALKEKYLINGGKGESSRSALYISDKV